MTHQAILDAIRAYDDGAVERFRQFRHGEQQVRAKLLEVQQAQCGELGHLYGKGSAYLSDDATDKCVVCEAKRL